jgi:hypothetical protein
MGWLVVFLPAVSLVVAFASMGNFNFKLFDFSNGTWSVGWGEKCELFCKMENLIKLFQHFVRTDWCAGILVGVCGTIVRVFLARFLGEIWLAMWVFSFQRSVCCPKCVFKV